MSGVTWDFTPPGCDHDQYRMCDACRARFLFGSWDGLARLVDGPAHSPDAQLHDCPSTTVNHRCECGEEYGPALHLAVNHFVSTGDVRPIRDLIVSWLPDGPAHSPDAQPGLPQPPQSKDVTA